MLQAAGPKFDALLHEVFSTIWQHEIQPKAWQMSLMQPIYKSDGKARSDPESYRGIYLSSALAKFFEGILISRLTKFTKTKKTLTENQLGTLSQVSLSKGEVLLGWLEGYQTSKESLC